MRESSTAAWKEYKKSRQSAKGIISSANEKKLKESVSDLNNHDCQNEIFRIAKQMEKERQDTTGSNCLKGVLGTLMVDKKGIKDT